MRKGRMWLKINDTLRKGGSMRRDEGSFCTKETVFEVYGLKDDFLQRKFPRL